MLGRGAMEKHSRPATRQARDLHVLPRDAQVQTGADRLGGRLFRGKASSESLDGVLLRLAVLDLGGRVDAAEEALAKAFDSLRDARDLADVDARADDHQYTPRSAPSFTSPSYPAALISFTSCS